MVNGDKCWRVTFGVSVVVKVPADASSAAIKAAAVEQWNANELEDMYFTAQDVVSRSEVPCSESFW